MSTLHVVTSFSVASVDELYNLQDLVGDIRQRLDDTPRSYLDNIHHHITVTVPTDFWISSTDGTPATADEFLEALRVEHLSDRYCAWPVVFSTQHRSHLSLLFSVCDFDPDDMIMFQSLYDDFVVPPGLVQLQSEQITFVALPGPATVNGITCQFQNFMRKYNQGTLNQYFDPNNRGYRSAVEVGTE